MLKRHGYRWPLLLLAVISLLLVAGCGGGGDTTPPSNNTKDPVEDPTKNSSIGGTVFTIDSMPGETVKVISQAYNVAVQLTDESNASNTKQTRSTIRGSYSFPTVTPGVYSISATATAPNIPGRQISGTVTGVRARGNIPTLMANLLLFNPDAAATIHGTITDAQGQVVEGATVSVEVDAYSADLYTTGDDGVYSVLLTTSSKADGTYAFTVPAGCMAYYVTAHTNTSMVQEFEILTLAVDENKVANLQLNVAETPTFARWNLWITASTLPDATRAASQRVASTRLALARALKASPARLQRIENAARLRHASRAVDGGFIENDLEWYINPNDTDVGVRGFHVYRGNTADGPFTKLGSTYDPYATRFYDNDPSLEVGTPKYYTIASYAANDHVSPLASSAVAKPLPRLQVTSPAAGGTVSGSTVQVAWNPVADATVYVVMMFADEPTYNAIPLGEVHINPPTQTEATLSLPGTGNYWISVSAYRVDDPTQLLNPLYATAASYAPLIKVTY